MPTAKPDLTLPENEAPEKGGRPLPLEHLDGLRGLAALYVLFYHAHLRYPQSGGWAGAGLQAFLHVLTFGHFAVNIFIVLSGYCLMLPVARSVKGELRGGTRNFFLRRARRILPPYYAALGLSLVLLACLPTYRAAAAAAEWLPAFTPGVLLSHLFLVHNLSQAWEFKIDGPMWSVSTEWGIYFLFPLLIPIWRRGGLFAALGLALLLGLAPHPLFHGRFDLACPHFFILFALGMVGAAIGFSTRPREVSLRDALPWGVLLAALSANLLLILGGVHAHGVAAASALLCLIAAVAGRRAWMQSGLVVLLPALLYLASALLPPRWIGYGIGVDVLTGVWAMCLLVFLARSLTDPTRPVPRAASLLLGLLQSRAAVTLGVFSYSLYLVHDIVMTGFRGLSHRLALPPGALLAVDLGIGVPLALLVSYLFFLVFERPFLTARRHPTASDLARAAAVSPAP